MTKTQKRALELLLKRVRLETARIAFSQAQVQAICERRPRGESGFPADDTAEIREAMAIYRESWITPLITALLEGDTDLLKQLTARP